MVSEYTLLNAEESNALREENWFEKEAIACDCDEDAVKSYFVPTHRLTNVSMVAIPGEELKGLLSDILMMSLQSESANDSQKFTEIKKRLEHYLKEK